VCQGVGWRWFLVVVLFNEFYIESRLRDGGACQRKVMMEALDGSTSSYTLAST
jgi:hypothetical protein